jgi:hypothetical protein
MRTGRDKGIEHKGEEGYPMVVVLLWNLAQSYFGVYATSWFEWFEQCAARIFHTADTGDQQATMVSLGAKKYGETDIFHRV